MYYARYFSIDHDDGGRECTISTLWWLMGEVLVVFLGYFCREFSWVATCEDKFLLWWLEETLNITKPDAKLCRYWGEALQPFLKGGSARTLISSASAVQLLGSPIVHLGKIALTSWSRQNHVRKYKDMINRAKGLSINYSFLAISDPPLLPRGLLPIHFFWHLYGA